MKKVFLIGDSIRYGIDGENGYLYGYGYFVKEKLKGEMEVYAPDENCRFLQYTLRYLHEWAAKIEDWSAIDVVQWNNGLWDALRQFGEEPFTPLPMYKEYLVRVYKRIRLLFPNAKIIFALSTPVSEEMARPDFTRKNSEIEQYNQAAIEVMDTLGVPVNDLYTLASQIRGQYYLDWVHYNAEGSAILADKVIDAIRKVLDDSLPE